MDALILDERLAAVARWVLPGQVVADIGTDHAYLPVHLVLHGKCPAAIAADVAPGPYQRALTTVRQYGLQDLVQVRLGSGLTVLEPGEAATLVLAGMGGRLMCQLLDARPEVTAKAERLVLQPQKNPELVRCFLRERHWRIVADDLATDGRLWYPIIVAEAGEMELTEAETEYGVCTPVVDGRLRRRWLYFRRQSLLELRTLLEQTPGAAAEVRRQQLEEETLRLEKLIGEVDDA